MCAVAEDGLVFLDLHDSPLDKSAVSSCKSVEPDNANGSPEICSGVSGKQVWILLWDGSLLPIIGIGRLTLAADPLEGMLELPCVRSCIFRALGLPDTSDRPAHLICLISALPKRYSTRACISANFFCEI